MCNKPAFSIIDAASQEVLLVSELTLANTAQTENNGATLVSIKIPDPRTQTADSKSSKTLPVDQKQNILTHRTRTEPESLTCCHPSGATSISPPPPEKKRTKLSTHLLKSEAVRSSPGLFTWMPPSRGKKKKTESELLYFIDRPTRTELAADEPLAEGRNNPYLV